MIKKVTVLLTDNPIIRDKDWGVRALGVFQDDTAALHYVRAEICPDAYRIAAEEPYIKVCDEFHDYDRIHIEHTHYED